MQQFFALRGMRIFLLVWCGQLISLIGSELTSFALGVWVYQRTGDVTPYALISLFTLLPGSLISPLAGALVDRWDRRWTMIISDCGSALSTLAIVLLVVTGYLEIWHLYLAITVSSLFRAFQLPAYQASVTVLISKNHLGRAIGMTQLSWAVAGLVAPVLAGILLGLIQLQGIIVIDLLSFLFALLTLLLVRFPSAKIPQTKQENPSSLLQETKDAWNYIRLRAGLMGLLIFRTFYDFSVEAITVLIVPLILSFASPPILGLILFSGGLGMVIGSLIISAWGGGEQLVRNVVIFRFLGGLCIFIAGFFSVPLFLAFLGFLYYFGLPISAGCDQLIWQRKIPPELQGRVFAIRQTVVTLFLPVAYLGAGLLADRVFKPLMAENGLLASSVGAIIGVGAGRGIGLMFIIIGFITMLISSLAYGNPQLRAIEADLPDAIAEHT